MVVVYSLIILIAKSICIFACMKDIIELRRKLHSCAELSGKEYKTAGIISGFLEGCKPDQLIPVAETGLLAVYDSGVPGNTVLFRADTDALPIEERNGFKYRSVNAGVSHKCGHDGHTAILAGLAYHIAYNRPVRGRALLLFQPAEETGEGALKAIREISGSKPDYAFAMHNLPGYELKSVVLKDGTFSAASRGMTIELSGRSSHASEPEKGISPARALASLISELPGLSHGDPVSDDYNMLTIVHCRLGDKAFGTSPGEAVLMVTLRGSSDEKIELLAHQVNQLVAKYSSLDNLQFEISFSEIFPATINNPEASEIIRNAALSAGMKVHDLTSPFRWSEDFGHFSTISKSVLFGIGAGYDHLPLHNPGYDFPDEIIPSATNLWVSVYERMLR